METSGAMARDRFISRKSIATKLDLLPTWQILALAAAVWVVGAAIIAQVSSLGYGLFTMWEIVSPTLITLFLYFRSVIRESSARSRCRLRLAWLTTLTVVVALGGAVAQRHQAANDTADIWWTIYQIAALLFGSASFWVSLGLARLVIRDQENPEVQFPEGSVS